MWSAATSASRLSVYNQPAATVVAAALPATIELTLLAMLIVLFAVNLHWLPTSGIGTWQDLVLPTLTLPALLYPQVALLTRAVQIGLKLPV